MNVTDILAATREIEQELIDRGFIRPTCRAWIGQDTLIEICYFNMEQPPGEQYHTTFNHADPANLVSAFADELAHIRGLKTPKQCRDEAILAKLGRLIDEARAADFPLEFLNPLETSMRELSENILEHRK